MPGTDTAALLEGCLSAAPFALNGKNYMDTFGQIYNNINL